MSLIAHSLASFTDFNTYFDKIPWGLTNRVFLPCVGILLVSGLRTEKMRWGPGPTNSDRVAEFQSKKPEHVTFHRDGNLLESNLTGTKE